MATSTIFAMISSTAQYALRATVFLGIESGGFVGRAAIAEATLVPPDYLLKVLGLLDAKGIVESRRGPGGGYRLTASPDTITVLQVVLAVDTIPRISECPLGFDDHQKLCPLHQLLDDTSRKVEEAFGETTIEDLIPCRKKSNFCEFPKQTNQV